MKIIPKLKNLPNSVYRLHARDNGTTGAQGTSALFEIKRELSEVNFSLRIVSNVTLCS